jgi:VWFA-related protein
MTFLTIRNIFLTSVILFVNTLPALAQEVKLRPTPPDSDVVKISTNLIQIDVTVTDSKGKIVSDLRPDEIEIYENGEKQKISNFSFVSSSRERSGKPEAVDPLAPPPPTTLAREQIRRTIALVVDDLSLSFESAYYTRRALKKYVDEQMQDGDLVAIVRTGAGVGALQQFTADKRILYAAIERVLWNPQGNGGISAFTPIESTALGGDEAEETEEPAGSGETLEDFRSAVFSTGTLGALRYIVNGMSELPGRKSVILFSDGFPLFENDQNGTQRGGRVLNFINQLIDTANRASVVFYTIDARGLVYTGLTAADNTGGMTPTAMNEAMGARSRQLFDTQQGLSYLAVETGGFSIKNNNDLSGGVRKVLEDQSYYLIGYQPDGDTFDSATRKFNKLDIKVLRKGTTVRYRSGFFNIASREASAPIAAKGTPVQQLQSALLSPFTVNGIDLRLNALFGSNAKNEGFVRSLLHVDINGMNFVEQPDGTRKGVFDVLAMIFGDNGQTVGHLWKTYTMNVKPAAFSQLAKDGFVYNFSFPVKNAGAYQYRVAIRDSQGGNIGSASQFIDVPNLKKKRPVMSGVILQTFRQDEREARANDPKAASSDPAAVTARRRIPAGSIVTYNTEIYNARLDDAKQPRLSFKIRVFRDGKLILDGVQKPVSVTGQKDMTHIKTSGAFQLSDKMLAGEYVLQLVVVDELAKKKEQVATQFVQFQVVQ